MKDALGFSIESQKKAGVSTYKLAKRRIVIGASTSCDLRLDEVSVSPIHAILEIDEAAGKITLYDLASESGVKVNGTAVVQTEVKKGDTIQIGSFFLKLQPLEALRSSMKQEDLSSLILEDQSEVREIFDYRPESQRSLQVVMFYIDTILEVSHFVKKKRIVIGPKAGDDFGVPPLLSSTGKSPGRYELVSLDEGQYTLNLDKAMTGVISQGGVMKPVKQFLADTGSSKMVPLSDKDFAKVSVGDVSFFINFTPAPPRLRWQRLLDRDPLFVRIWFSSLAVTLMAIIAFSHMTVNPTIEIEQLPERIATVIYKPELLPIEQPKPKPEPQEKIEKPKPLELKKPVPKVIHVTPKAVTKPAPKNPVIDEAKPATKETKPTPQTPVKELPKNKVQPHQAKVQPKPAITPPKHAAAANKAGNEGEGARAKGDNGTRGKTNAKPSDTHQTKAQRPGEGSKNAPAVARAGHSQVQDMGVVDVFKNTGGMLNKLLAGGKGVSGAADKLEGYGGFTTQGAGGLGDAGSGAGGGGKSQGLGGLSDKGVGGGKKGTGLGALGSGGNIIGGKGRLVIAGTNGAPEPIVLGAIDSDAIAREIAKHRDEIKYCYEKEINAEHPDLAGRVSVRWVIGASGAVTTAGVSSTSLHHGGVESCVVDVIKRIVFPPVRGGGIAEVTYPFVFRPANK